eukprot:4704146-Amphidinium_carterae.1
MADTERPAIRFPWRKPNDETQTTTTKFTAMAPRYHVLPCVQTTHIKCPCCCVHKSLCKFNVLVSPKHPFRNKD